MSSPSRSFTAFTRATLSVIAAIVACTASAGLGASVIVATIIAAGVAGLVFRQLLLSPSADAALATVPVRIRRLFVIGATLLMVQLVLAAAFILDPNLARWDAWPWTAMRSSHSCVSAYWVACDRIGTVPDIYAEEIYSVPQANPAAVRVGRTLGPLIIDQYEYPPPFLVVPRLITAVTEDFWGFRRLWFALNLAVVVIGVIVIAQRFDRALATHALWLTPYVLVPPAIISTFVIGNVQLAIIAASMIAMLMFERGRHAAGGILLAYALVSKLYPGLLLLYLLIRRDWRALGWTSVFAIAWVGISVAEVGIAPYVSFATHMPKLLSGEAFPAFRNAVAIAINESVPGLAFKLQLFGVPRMGFAASRALGWVYTFVAVWLTARLALRPVYGGREPLAWLTILILATLRSPFLPTYGPFPSIWLVTLLAALMWGQVHAIKTLIAVWIVLAFAFGTGGAPPMVNAVWTFTHTVAAFFLVSVIVRRLPTHEPRLARTFTSV